MKYDVRWIQKHLGITRSTLLVYENPKWAFVKPTKVPTDSFYDYSYRKYTEEDVIRIWYVKFLVKIGYSLKEIKAIFDSGADMFETLDDKIMQLEKELHEKEILVGHAKMIKMTGAMPGLPKDVGSVTFDEFLDKSLNEWNVYADSESTAMYNLAQKIIEKPYSEWDEEEARQAAEAILLSGYDIGAILEFEDLCMEMAKLNDLPPEHAKVQDIVKRLYILFKEKLYTDSVNEITTAAFARHMMRSFIDGDIGKVQEQNLGRETSQFIAQAFACFGGISRGDL